MPMTAEKQHSTVDNLEVLYEDNHLIAVNKRASDIVQGDRTGDTPLSEVVKAYIKKKYNKSGEVFLGVIHRLDRPVSGAVVFARTSKALSRMNQLFQNRAIQKTYWAVVDHVPKVPSGKRSDWLKRDATRNKSFVTRSQSVQARLAELSYTTRLKSDKYVLLEVHPHTGRHHQIRVQLSHMGSIIKGDLKYGAPRSNKDASIHLHARQLDFIHPTQKKTITIVAPVPKHDPLWQYFEANV